MIDNKTKKNGNLALAIMAMIAAFFEFLNPTIVRPAGGRWSWFFSMLWDINNNNLGIQLYWIVLAGFFYIAYYRIKEV